MHDLKELGIKITHSKKQINIFDYHGNFICTIGGKNYHSYVKQYGQHYAENKRLEYWCKHRKKINKFGSVAYYTAFLLW
jgi:hypothetical protein